MNETQEIDHIKFLLKIKIDGKFDCYLQSINPLRKGMRGNKIMYYINMVNSISKREKTHTGYRDSKLEAWQEALETFL